MLDGTTILIMNRTDRRNFLRFWFGFVLLFTFSVQQYTHTHRTQTTTIQTNINLAFPAFSTSVFEMK